MFAAITRQRLRLADTLETLDASQWETPSLCAGWKIRDVVGHLVTPLEVPTWKAGLGVIRSGGFSRWADRTARRLGQREPSALVASLRQGAHAEFAPPGLGPRAPLTDVITHTRDIERPLGISAAFEPADLAVALEFLTSGKARGFVAASRTAGLRFVASDIDWSGGQGPSVEGPAEAIVLSVLGRKVALADVSGDGAATLAQRLG